eukprot:jgi/Mesen1/4531/ME000231S03794
MVGTSCFGECHAPDSDDRRTLPFPRVVASLGTAQASTSGRHILQSINVGPTGSSKSSSRGSSRGPGSLRAERRGTSACEGSFLVGSPNALKPLSLSPRHADPLGGLRGGDRDGSHGRPGARTLTVVAAAPEYNARGYPSRTFKGENDPSLGLPYERIRTQFPIKDTRNVHTRAMKLIKLVKKLSNVKEEVYAALNEWAAWEQDFPLLAIKSGLQLLKKDQEWLRIIQDLAAVAACFSTPALPRPMPSAQ